MRHRKQNKKFGRSKSHREQLLRMLVSSLILNGRIRTTLPKAKATRSDAEKMVTLARKGTLASRRLAAARLRSVEAVQKLFDDVVPAMAGRPGGYTRIVKTDFRKGDGAEMAFIEWVTHTLPEKEPAAEAK
ncbi:MAG: 50S ribosomal protein L17 [Kiritimatiellaeota bacterium]|nr:50S ribosomal protein L17 [Kiritimatiellota bacterium]